MQLLGADANMSRMEAGNDRGKAQTSLADTAANSGWVCTYVVAKAVRVSLRTISRYIERGELEAKSQAEGVSRAWHVSVGRPARALRFSRSAKTSRRRTAKTGPQTGGDPRGRASGQAARLGRRADEAAQLWIRLELTASAQSTVDQEAQRLREENGHLREELRTVQGKRLWARLLGP